MLHTTTGGAEVTELHGRPRYLTTECSNNLKHVLCPSSTTSSLIPRYALEWHSWCENHEILWSSSNWNICAFHP